ncbi:uncharacterized protein LOC121682463 isoform X2 [Alosa sapidissima]|uniref:uncharacterized protein LOC121682463 isoform X2 n=1 Tax=Alosa sapidissima TaxID=34773 RepID=UPI001C0A3091|nr:uncharacterized protein LOC121682463 isoform X2 [Alosa sapidissima]
MGIFSGLFRQKRRPTKKFKRDLSYAVLLLCLIKMKNWCSGEAGAPLAFAVWVDFSSESPTFNFTGPKYLEAFWTNDRKAELLNMYTNRGVSSDALGGERPYVDPDISGTHCRMAIGRLIKEHALSQGLSRPEYLPQHRPPWWPEELPFASVSDGKGEGRKAFTAEKLRKVVRSYNAYYNLQQSVEAPPSPPSPATPAAATPAAPLTPLNPHPTP